MTAKPEQPKIRLQVDPCLVKDWESDFSDIIISSITITSSTVTVNGVIGIDFQGDREDAESFVLYLLAKPKTK